MGCLVRPETLGTGQTVHDQLLDRVVFDIRDTCGTVLDLESSFTRVNLARSVFAADVLNTGDEGTVGTLSFGCATSARVKGGEEVEAFSL